MYEGQRRWPTPRALAREWGVLRNYLISSLSRRYRRVQTVGGRVERAESTESVPLGAEKNGEVDDDVVDGVENETRFVNAGGTGESSRDVARGALREGAD